MLQSLVIIVTFLALLPETLSPLLKVLCSAVVEVGLNDNNSECCTYIQILLSTSCHVEMKLYPFQLANPFFQMIAVVMQNI